MAPDPTPRGEASPSAASSGYRLLAHTADTAFEAWGPTRAACYAEAVSALVASFAEVSDAPLVARRQVEFGPGSAEDLLVDLLEEVIYLLDTRGLLPVRAELRDQKDGRVEGRLELAAVTSVQLSGAVPKAVTYHALRVDATDAGWLCHVTVDV